MPKDEKLDKLMKDGWSYRTTSANVTLTDSDIDRVINRIDAGVARDKVPLKDKKTGDVYDLYVNDSNLSMEKVESEG